MRALYSADQNEYLIKLKPAGNIDSLRCGDMKPWIADWRPEDEAFWEASGRRTARRNLIWSILAENIGFSVWLLWSVTATRLPAAGFKYSTDQLFALVSLPGLIGALMRFPYTF